MTTALGGRLANGARLLTIACAILLTIFKDRFWPSLPHDLDVNSDRTEARAQARTTAPSHPVQIS
jgi:hypothetical protein